MSLEMQLLTDSFFVVVKFNQGIHVVHEKEMVSEYNHDTVPYSKERNRGHLF